MSLKRKLATKVNAGEVTKDGAYLEMLSLCISFFAYIAFEIQFLATPQGSGRHGVVFKSIDS